ncbi:MAG: glycosyltransferase [Bacteroidales bacterium]|nr:glycosyltransferase [Bacteroidales bacterium]
MSPKNIIILGSAYPLRGGGISTFNERLAQAFLDHGDRVKILTFSLQYPSILFPGKTQLSDSPKPDLDIEVCVNSINPFNWIKIGRKIKKMNPDLLIFRYWIPFMAPCFGTIAKKVRKNKHTKIIAITDNVIPHESFFWDKPLTNYFLKSMHGFLAMSHSVMNDLQKFDTIKPRIFTRHPLYDNYGKLMDRNDAIQQLGLDVKFRYLLFFGLIRDYKGLDLLLTAMSHPAIKNAPIKLIVAGEFYTDQKPYLDLIKNNHLENNVILHTHFIPEADVRTYFSACDIVVQPYKDATQSGVTQVAYHFEKPVITTNVGGLSEIVLDGKTGYIVNPDSDLISKKIIQFFEENRYDEFVSNIKTEKTKYSWEQFIASIYNVYQQI